MTISQWSIAEAKARFSEVVVRASEKAQRVTNRGREVAVVLSPTEYERLLRAAERPEHRPMRAFLEAAEALRAEGELELELLARRRTKGRGDPFGARR